MDFKGKAALVTGSSKGIGESIATRLSRLGFNVVITGRDYHALEKLKNKLQDYGNEVHAVVTDITKPGAPRFLIDETMDALGNIDLLINNAGCTLSKPLVDTYPDDWDQMMTLNAKVPFFLCKESIPHLEKSECATIINISSVVGRIAYVNQSAYTASKHALMGFSKALAKEVQHLGIRVHTIAPGGVATEMVKITRPDLDTSELIQPEDIADTVEFLLKLKRNTMIDNIDLRRSNSTPFT